MNFKQNNKKTMMKCFVFSQTRIYLYCMQKIEEMKNAKRNFCSPNASFYTHFHKLSKHSKHKKLNGIDLHYNMHSSWVEILSIDNNYINGMENFFKWKENLFFYASEVLFWGLFVRILEEEKNQQIEELFFSICLFINMQNK